MCKANKVLRREYGAMEIPSGVFATVFNEGRKQRSENRRKHLHCDKAKRLGMNHADYKEWKCGRTKKYTDRYLNIFEELEREENGYDFL